MHCRVYLFQRLEQLTKKHPGIVFYINNTAVLLCIDKTDIIGYTCAFHMTTLMEQNQVKINRMCFPSNLTLGQYIDSENYVGDADGLI